MQRTTTTTTTPARSAAPAAPARSAVDRVSDARDALAAIIETAEAALAEMDDLQTEAFEEIEAFESERTTPEDQEPSAEDFRASEASIAESEARAVLSAFDISETVALIGGMVDDIAEAFED